MNQTFTTTPKNKKRNTQGRKHKEQFAKPTHNLVNGHQFVSWYWNQQTKLMRQQNETKRSQFELKIFMLIVTWMTWQHTIGHSPTISHQLKFTNFSYYVMETIGFGGKVYDLNLL